MNQQLRTVICLILVVALGCVIVPAVAGASVPPAAPETAAPAPSSVQSSEATTSDPATQSPPLYRLEDDRSAMRFAGRWTYGSSAGSSGMSQRYSTTARASASLAFIGTGVSVIGQVGPDHGLARVYLDGVATSVVSFYAPTHQDAREILKITGLTSGRHTLRVVVLGSKESPSSGAYVHLDAFDIEGGTVAALGKVPGVRVQNGDKRLYRRGAWSTVKSADAYRGTLVKATARGAAVTMRFKGTDVIWYGRKGILGGKSEVWLDGKRVAVVSQYCTETVLARRVVWAATGLRNTTHDLVIKSLGEPSTPGGGTRTDYDAFQVRGVVGTALRPTPFKYPWKTYIVIDKSSYTLYWVRNKMLVKAYPIAHGKNNCTPERTWRIDAKYHTSPGSVYGPRKMRMFKRVSTSRGYRYVFTAYAIHGTNQEWVIGTQASHGCIRMYNKDVRELFPQVPKGTMVVTRK